MLLTVRLPSMEDVEIAAQIGTVREVVSRHLGQLQMKGIIRITGRAMQVVDANALAGEALEPDRISRALSFASSD